MRYFTIFSTAITIFATLTTAHPSNPINSLLSLDFSDKNIKQTLLSMMNQLPVNVNVWAMNRTAGIAGVEMKLDISELAKVGLVSVSPDSSNAKVDINVTVTGLN
ncbi:hypothetical protein PHISCL_05514 [Aspergillus sclerotialis]|uniref:Uncharacterized protein n=1 Tax=Aspergillus sclerotialis TaxID=2070753 RepID=A0A3A2ZYM6_9EURO|nr:hypothetical protein PHISCL_05514 [Aspergillus sclerotialis]